MFLLSRRAIRLQQNGNFIIHLYISHIYHVCMYDMVNEPCKKHKDWGNCHVYLSDIAMKTASFSNELRHTTGINRDKAILAQCRICTIVFTGKLKHMKHILLHCLQSNEHISLLASVVWVIKMFVWENKGNRNFLVSVLPTYVMIKIVD